jgi:hypothetical protein
MRFTVRHPEALFAIPPRAANLRDDRGSTA